MMDDNYNVDCFDDFDSEYIETENEAYEVEVDNKVWINELLEGIDLDFE